MAASAQGIRAGGAFIELFTRDSALTKGLKAAYGRVRQFGAAVAGIGAKIATMGAQIAAPFLAASKTFAEGGSELFRASKRTGVAVEALSELRYAAEMTGSDLAGLEVGFKKMQKTIGEAAMGAQEAQVTLGSLGLPIRMLYRLKPEDQFKAIAEQISKIRNPSLQAYAALKIFGKSGTMLLPILQGGARGIAAFQKRARDLGLTVSTEDATAAEKWKEALDILWRVLGKITIVIGSALTPMLLKVAAWMVRAGKAVKDWIKENKPLVTILFKVGVALVAVGGALVTVGTAFGGLSIVLGPVLKLLGPLAPLLTSLLNPIPLLIAAVAGLAVYFTRHTKTVGNALNWLQRQFGPLLKEAQGAFQGIADAFTAGDLKLAVEIFWAFLKLEWIKGSIFLKGYWFSTTETLGDFWRDTTARFATDLADGLKVAEVTWFLFTSGLKIAWVEATGFIGDEWLKLLDGIGRATDDIFGRLRKDFINLRARIEKEWVTLTHLTSGRALVAPQRELAEKLAKVEEGAEKARKEVDFDKAARKVALDLTLAFRENERKKALGNIIPDLFKKLQISPDEQARKMLIELGRTAQADAAKRARDAAMLGDQAALYQAQFELNRLKFIADTLAARVESPFGEPLEKAPGEEEGEAEKKTPLDLAMLAAKPEAKGTFSAAAASAMGLGDTQSEILKEAQKMVQEQIKTNYLIMTGNMVYGS